MLARNTIAVAFALLPATSAMAAGTTAGFEKGGRYARFDPMVSRYNQSGELFRECQRRSGPARLLMRALVAQAEHALRLREAGNRKLAEIGPA
jgi:hypothetical protein